jgi:hypothetical protein
MYLKTTARRGKHGEVRYLQLAHNQWDAEQGRSVPKILYRFGREDQLDRDAIRRLIASLSRLLNPGEALAATTEGPELVFCESRPIGGTWVLDALWRQLGIDTALREARPRRGRGRPRDDEALERVLFAMVANRALAPASKLAAAEWVNHDVHLDGLAETSDDACYRAMDWLCEVGDKVARQVFWSTATLLDLEVDLVFFDSTSTYWERDTADEPATRDERGEPVAADDPAAVGLGSFRTFGHSKDHREDRPQVVVGMAVTRGGIPIRCWSWPGNTADVTMIDQVRADLRDWSLARMVWVTDRGFASEHNRRVLRTGGGHYIQAERLRHPTAEAAAALARPGRYRTVAGNLRVKEVAPKPGDSVTVDRFIVCHNPERADRDAAVRTELVAQLEGMIDGSDSWSQRRRDEFVGSLRASPGLRRYLRRDRGGRLRVDQAAIATEAKLDGKWLLRCSDPKLPAEDIAAGYKQLLEVERGWRDLKTTLELRPVFHHREDRIRAHVQLCWLALLLIRVAETTTGQTWPVMRRERDRLHAGTFTGQTGTFRQRTELTKPQRDLFTALEITPPPQMLELAATSG